jgi:hypothetical protein
MRSSDGLTDEELRALRLLTRSAESLSEAGYLAHIDLIGRASGPAGELARTVKRVDLEDRIQNPRRHPDGWHPPYQLALELLRTGPGTLGSEAGRDSVSRETPGLAPDLATTTPQPRRTHRRLVSQPRWKKQRRTT